MKRPLATCALLACCAQLAAQPAQPATPTLGRLFHTPGERYQLDVARGTAQAPAAAPAPLPAPPAYAPVTLDGFVRGSGGKSTVWLNQTAQRGAQISGSSRQSRVSVTLPGGQRVLLKPGQSVDSNAGTVRDVDTP